MLDAIKAFDRVRYCKLLNEILDRDISPVLKYVMVSGKVGFCLLFLFAVYVDNLLGRLEQSGGGCHIGGHFVCALAYANDVTLVVPSRSRMPTLINVCEQFVLYYDITFNDTKSHLLFLKVDFIMFLLAVFMLMDNMLKFLSVQCTLSMQKEFLG